MRVAELAARACISIGGIGTIVAVTLILVFLVWVVLPLFTAATKELRASTVVHAGVTNELRAFGVDEYRDVGFAVKADGTLETWRASDGQALQSFLPFGSTPPTSVSSRDPDGEMAFGFADGTVRLGRLGFHSLYADPTDDADLERELASVTATAIRDGALVRRMPDGQLRQTRIELTLRTPTDVGLAAPIVALDLSTTGSSHTLVALDAQGRGVCARVSERENLMTGEIVVEAETHPISIRLREGRIPSRLMLSGGGDIVLALWDDGVLQRHSLRDLEHPVLCEEIDLVEGEGRLTAATFLIGKSTLISGDSLGRVRGWFGIKPDDARTPDGMRIERTHELCTGGAAVTALSASTRGRIVSAGFADGSLRTYHVTSHKLLFETRVPADAGIRALAIAPKEDGLVALAGDEFFDWNMDVGHPEATLAALFRPVWYEGYPEPTHTWQSTGGTDDFEAKLGLWPLVFGTLKATFYSMLFGVPIAMLAAIFTSEFLHKRLKGPLKSTTEMMASLPSVVLGFLSAIVIAPFVQGCVPTVLAAFFTIPIAFLFGAHLWQLLPGRLAIQLSGIPRFLAMAAALPLGIGLAMWCGPVMERVWFAGDIMSWLAGARGDAVGGWVLLLVPLCGLAWVLLSNWLVSPWVRRITTDWDRTRSARLDLAKFAIGIMAVLGLSLALAHVLDGLGFDPRGGPLDTYVQRNALIVGFVMGFAVIPIIYTLAEDSLSSVPSHLRLASLGAGATPWQTAWRIVVPTAMSGLFSAVMVGLGRAVGETMIVVMATGNTPITSWNVFDGFRTLSANIAVEMPEAVRNSTHYRTLFLAAVCLFGLTFVLNTFAEVVRQRFRRRASQL